MSIFNQWYLCSHVSTIIKIKVFDKPFEFISLGDASPTETNSEHAQHRRLYRARVQS